MKRTGQPMFKITLKYTQLCIPLNDFKETGYLLLHGLMISKSQH